MAILDVVVSRVRTTWKPAGLARSGNLLGNINLSGIDGQRAGISNQSGIDGQTMQREAKRTTLLDTA